MKRKKFGTRIALEISDGVIKACVASVSKAGVSIQTASRAVPTGESTAVKDAVASIFSELNITPESVIVNIPRHHVMVRFLSVPSVKDEEIHDIVKMESLRQSPYGPDESVTGMKVIEKKKDGYSDILMAIAQKDFVENIMALLDAMNISVSGMSLGTEALMLWFKAATAGKEAEQAMNQAIVNIDGNNINIDLCAGLKLTYSRAFAHRGELSVNARTVSDEVIKTVTAYQKEKGVTVERVIVTGVSGRVNDIISLISSAVSIPVIPAMQQGGATIDERSLQNMQETSYAELIGLAVSDEPASVNLLPAGMQKEQELRGVKLSLTKTILLLTAAVLVLSAISVKGLVYRTKTAAALDKELAKMTPKITEMKNMKDALSIINEQVRTRPLAIEVLADIYKVTPTGVKYATVDYEAGKDFSVKGSADSMESVIRLVNVLETSPNFDNVKVKYTAKKDRGGSQETDFEVTGIVPAAAGEKKK